MGWAEVDVIVRVAGATLLVWAAISRPPGAAGRVWFTGLAICLTGFLAGNTPDAGLRLSGPVGAFAALAAGYAAVFLWWWCLAVFDRSFRPRGSVLAAGIAWVILASADRGLFGPWIESRGLSWALIALGLGMLAHLAWRLVRDQDDDLIDERRQARVAVIVALAAQLLADFGVDLVLGLEWSPQAFTVAQNAALLAFTGWLLRLDLGPVAPPRPVPAAGPGIEGAVLDNPLAPRLQRLMETDRIYLRPDLTFAEFCRALGASEKAARQLINHELGHDHFRAFLNVWRVEAAARMLRDPARRDDKLIAIAFDSGFASLPSFNRAFRAIKGCAPGAYRAAPPSEISTAAF